MIISAVVLAAGRGTRMGRTKQLLPLAGRPLVEHVVSTALGSCVDEVIVVLGYEAEAVRAAIPENEPRLRWVVNQEFASGQASSLMTGVGAASQQSDAVVVLLGDQPGVTETDVDTVVGLFRSGNHIAARACYEDGMLGHPTVIGRALWPEILNLQGDVGAREVLVRHEADVLMVGINRAAPRDVDTEVDYRSLVDANRSRG